MAASLLVKFALSSFQTLVKFPQFFYWVYVILVPTSSKSNVTSLKKFSNRHREIERPNVTTFIRNKKEKEEKLYLLIPFHFFSSKFLFKLLLSNTFETSIQASSYLYKQKNYIYFRKITRDTYDFPQLQNVLNDQIVSLLYNRRIIFNTRSRRFAYNRISTHCSNFKNGTPLPQLSRFGSRSITCEIYEPYKWTRGFPPHIVRSHILRDAGAGALHTRHTWKIFVN